MTCDLCENEEAMFMVGQMQTGDQQALGPGCFARLGLQFAKDLLPPEEIAATLGPMFVQGGKGEAEKPAGATKRAKQEVEPSKAPEPLREAQGPSEVATAAEDG